VTAGANRTVTFNSNFAQNGVLLGRLKRTTAPAQVSQDGMND
jgi:hypothetical protein